MLARAENPSRNEDNNLAAGIKHSPDHVIGEFSTKTKARETEPYLISHAINRKGKEKGPIDQRLRRKRQRNCHGHPKPLNCFLTISKSTRRSVK